MNPRYIYFRIPLLPATPPSSNSNRPRLRANPTLKMKFTKLLMAAALLAGLSLQTSALHAQSNTTPVIVVTAPAGQVPVLEAPPTPTNSNVMLPMISINGYTFTVPILNQPFMFQGQTFEVTTNANGTMTVVTFGPQGTNSMVVPQTANQVITFIQNAIENNNPANIDYYSTNGEWDFKLGGTYAQNTGQAAALVEVTRYGLWGTAPNLGVSVGVLQGTQNGQNGTAAEFGFLDYRHPIGDVAFVGGVGGGYDELTRNPMGLAKVGVEYRQSPHLGEWTSIAYDFEGWGSQVTAAGQTIGNRSGLMISGGINYAF